MRTETPSFSPSAASVPAANNRSVASAEAINPRSASSEAGSRTVAEERAVRSGYSR